MDIFTFSRSSHIINIYLNAVELKRFFLTELNREFFVSVMTHRPPPNSLDIKYSTEKLKLISLEHSEIHDSDGISSTRQDVILEDILDFKI